MKQVQRTARHSVAASMLTAALALAVPTDGYSHAGGLDSIGCDREGWTTHYHCHEGPLAGRRFDSISDAIRALRSRQQRDLTRGHEAAGAIVDRALVIDSDTIEVSGVRIRLFGVDAPESDQICSREGRAYAYGRDAKPALLDKLRQQTVACQPCDVDRYRRVVAVCRVGAEDVNAWLVPWGFRRYPTRLTPSPRPSRQPSETDFFNTIGTQRKSSRQ